jgi:ketosteroid isomerase-like protein
MHNLERIRAVLPDDGTDLAVAFGPARSFSAGGLVSDDATVRLVAPDAEMGGVGPEGFYDRWADWLEPWETYRVHHEDLIERGDEVIWLVRLRGVTKRGGVEMEHEGATVFRFAGGLVQEITFMLGRSGIDE